MDNSDVLIEVRANRLKKAIHAIEQSSASVCAGHPAIADALVALMEERLADLETEQRRTGFRQTVFARVVAQIIVYGLTAAIAAFGGVCLANAQ